MSSAAACCTLLTRLIVKQLLEFVVDKHVLDCIRIQERINHVPGLFYIRFAAVARRKFFSFLTPLWM